MLNAGIVLCHRCWTTSRGFFYYNGTLDMWVQLKRKSFGRFYVEQYTPNGYTLTKDTVSLVNCNKADIQNLKETIIVKITSEDGKNYSEQTFTRMCPNCKKKNDAIKNLGILPTYVVAVVGHRDVGKSCWIRGIGTPKNINSVKTSDEGVSRKYILDTKASSVTGETASTDIASDGETRILYIKETKVNKKNKKETQSEAIAAVLFVDFAGELFEEKNRTTFIESDAYKAFIATNGFDGVDAVIFMDDMTNDKLLTDAYNQVENSKVLENKPVAYVLTKIDNMFSNPPKNKRITEVSVNLFDRETFPQYDPSPYTKDKTVKRIALTTHITKQFSPLAKKILDNNSNSAGFMIKTCEPIKFTEIFYSGEKKRDNNYDNPINIMDPLIWILNKLDIFPF